MKCNRMYLILSILLVVISQSCTDMNDLTDKYLDEGEKTYAAKVDSVGVRAGENRIQLDVYIKAQRVDNLRVYWNNYEDSIDVEIGGKTGIFPVILDDMPESGYLFQLVCFDKFGNRSLAYEATGSCYGENYKNGLLNRSYVTEFTHYDMKGDSMIIYWGGTVRGSIGVELQYTDTSDKTIRMEIPADASTTILYKLKGNISYNSRFLPTEHAIDTFISTSKNIPVYYERPLDKSNWKIVGFSSASVSPEWPATNAIDGDINTPWHTEHDPIAPFPHYFIVDMGKVVDISSFEVYRRMDDSAGAQPTHQIFYAESLADPTNAEDKGWMNYGIYNLDNIVDIPQFSRASNIIKARYFMYYVASNPRSAYAYIGEIGAYTPVGDGLNH